MTRALPLRRVVGAAGIAVLAMLASACTGVPGTSHPETVEHLGGTTTPQATPEPPTGADARTIVQDFLQSNLIDAGTRGASRSFLTPGAKNRWLDTTTTILDSVQVRQYDPRHSTVTVIGRQVGTIDADGIYTPDLQGDGSSGGETLSFVFGMRKIAGQYRIDQLRNGLVMSAAQFPTVFTQRVVYFYDAEERYLVPDARYSAYSAESDPQTLANWLVEQLVAGPRQDLLNAESNAEFPAQVDVRHVIVKVGTQTTIEVPGSSELDGTHRDRLAAQLALTLDQAVAGGQFVITDGGRPVPIPSVGGDVFTALDFPSATGPQSQLPAPTVYYVRAGALVDQGGRRLPGQLGSGAYGLNSVAVAEIPKSADLYVAGVTGSTGNQSLLVGTETQGLRTVPKVTGQLTRPSWAPGLNEVWVASGTTLYRVAASGRADTITVGGLPAGARITALRLSPEGSRLAMVIDANGLSQAYVGTVARGAGRVSVEAVSPISPVDFRVIDVAWNDALKLFLVGVPVGTADTHVVEVQVDGSLWSSRSAPALPGVPDSITVAESLPAWVSVGGSVYQQSLGSWENAGGGSQTAGSAPVYLE